MERVLRQFVVMILIGALAGLVAGLVGAAVMEVFQSASSKLRESGGGEGDGEGGGAGAQRSEPERLEAVAREGGAAEEDPTTVKVAAAATSITGSRLREADKKPAGRLVHYLFGAGNAVAYGALAEVVPAVTAGFGALFGIAVWLYADNLLLWALGLAKRPTTYPASTHAYAFASHVVYGISVEAVRQLIRRAVAG